MTSALEDLIEAVEEEKVYDYGVVTSSVPGGLRVWRERRKGRLAQPNGLQKRRQEFRLDKEVERTEANKEGKGFQLLAAKLQKLLSIDVPLFRGSQHLIHKTYARQGK